MMVVPAEAPKNCALCPRLVDYRNDYKEKEPAWFNSPVPSFGDEGAKLLIVGLAPGVKGANRTGRPFTGDYAGDLLYPTLVRFGFAEGTYAAHVDDGLTLHDCMITNAVRCVPPQNKPTGAEIGNCRPFLVSRLQALTDLKIILALGRIAHDSLLTTFGKRKVLHKFAHGALHIFDDQPALIDSYHCSRYNTNTGRLTEEMFFEVFDKISDFLKQ